MQFGSDNQTGASAQVLQMIQIANTGYTHGYGDDDWSKQAEQALKEVFGCDLRAFFVPTGTAANCLALSCLVEPWETILCHHQAHIYLDESTAPEFFTGGARMQAISKGAGKISAELLSNYFLNSAGADFPHNSRAGALSITQASEVGQVYTPAEIGSLSSIAKQNDLHLHMDGARFANAVAHLGCTPAELSWQSGVDVLCLGATKCGALCAEAIIFFNQPLADSVSHRRKRTGHLLSKGRIFGAQFVGWLKDNHWLELAQSANHQAALLSSQLSAIQGINTVWPVESNELFVTMPESLFERLKQAGGEFYEWYADALPEDHTLESGQKFVRLVTSFATNDRHRKDFCDLIEKHYTNSQVSHSAS